MGMHAYRREKQRYSCCCLGSIFLKPCMHQKVNNVLNAIYCPAFIIQLFNSAATRIFSRV